MRTLDHHELHATAGGLTSNQTSYLVVLGVQAMVTFAATLALGTPEGLAIKYGLMPVLGIAATAFAYEFHNQVVEPKIFKEAA